MKTERGASIVEVLFAMAIMAMVMPFAYRQINSITIDVKTISVAKNMEKEILPVKNYLSIYGNEMEMDKIIEIPNEDKNKKVFALKSGDVIWGFIVIKNIDILESHKIATIIGDSAAVVEDDLTAYSQGGWAIKVPDGKAGDIVLRAELNKSSDDAANFLHKNPGNDSSLSTMKTGLYMNGFSILNIGNLKSVKINTGSLESYLINTGMLISDTIYFIDGANLNPEKSKIKNMKVNGDVIGFRNITTDNFNGKTIITDRTNISKGITVKNEFDVSSGYNRIVSGFAGVAASVVRAPYLETTNLTILPGFGLTISSELLYGSTAPIKFGNWSFPSAAGPKFHSINLTNFGKAITGGVYDFGNIVKANWK